VCGAHAVRAVVMSAVGVRHAVNAGVEMLRAEECVKLRERLIG